MNKEIQNEQELKEVAEGKNGIVTWVKAHKKQLVLIGISIPTLIAIAFSSRELINLKIVGCEARAFLPNTLVNTGSFLKLS